MNGSFVHMLHLIAFGIVVATLLPSFLLDRRLRPRVFGERRCRSDD